MRRPLPALVLLLLAGCESVAPEGGVFEPAPLPAPPAAPAPEAALAPEPDAMPVPPPAPEPEPEPEPEPAPAPAVPAVAPPEPEAPGPTGWPVRLVGTFADAQPPRAVIGLPDGEERVVVPGTMVPEEGLVVMEVGDGRVTLARVSPRGDHATVETVELTAPRR